jgi:hypothetical protein
MKISLRLVLGFFFLSTAALAAGEHHFEPYTGSAPFEKLKTLEGKWTGTVVEGGQTEEKPAEVVYEVSSGKTALVEKLFKGTPHEMVSIYNDENGELVMTHYCMMRNQPKLKLVAADKNEILLEMVEGNGVKKTDDHMHSLKIKFTGKDEITQEWDGYKDGKLAGTPTVLKLKRTA